MTSAPISFPALARWLQVDEMISRRGSLDEIDELYRALSNHEVARSVITFDSQRA